MSVDKLNELIKYYKKLVWFHIFMFCYKQNGILQTTINSVSSDSKNSFKSPRNNVKKSFILHSMLFRIGIV